MDFPDTNQRLCFKMTPNLSFINFWRFLTTSLKNCGRSRQRPICQSYVTVVYPLFLLTLKPTWVESVSLPSPTKCLLFESTSSATHFSFHLWSQLKIWVSKLYTTHTYERLTSWWMKKTIQKVSNRCQFLGLQSEKQEQLAFYLNVSCEARLVLLTGGIWDF